MDARARDRDSSSNFTVEYAMPLAAVSPAADRERISKKGRLAGRDPRGIGWLGSLTGKGWLPGVGFYLVRISLLEAVILRR